MSTNKIKSRFPNTHRDCFCPNLFCLSWLKRNLASHKGKFQVILYFDEKKPNAKYIMVCSFTHLWSTKLETFKNLREWWLILFWYNTVTNKIIHHVCMYNHHKAVPLLNFITEETCVTQHQGDVMDTSGVVHHANTSFMNTWQYLDFTSSKTDKIPDRRPWPVKAKFCWAKLKKIARLKSGIWLA